MSTSAIFSSPFRAWFFSGTFFAVALMLPWTAQYLLPLSWQPFHGLFWFHQHEMVFGFAVPFVMGFLLTASQNWTGEAPINSIQLMILVLLWWVARLAILLNAPTVWVLLADVIPIVTSALLLAGLLWRHNNTRNLIMAGLLLLLGGISALQILVPGQMLAWSRLAILTLVLLIVIFGGRVIPFFTARGLGITKKEPIVALEKALLIAQFIATLLLPFMPYSAPLRWLAAIIGLLHLIRWSYWQTPALWRVPLLWSLQLAYLILALTWVLIAWRGLDTVALHGLTIGGIGLMIVAFSGRVSLAHSGRPLVPSRLFSVTALLLILAAGTRAGLPAIGIEPGVWLYVLAGALWIAAYGLFLLVYTPIWFKARTGGH